MSFFFRKADTSVIGKDLVEVGGEDPALINKALEFIDTAPAVTVWVLLALIFRFVMARWLRRKGLMKSRLHRLWVNLASLLLGGFFVMAGLVLYVATG